MSGKKPKDTDIPLLLLFYFLQEAVGSQAVEYNDSKVEPGALDGFSAKLRQEFRIKERK